jgi:catechol 2,3-dioxygenase-like lactoylglutathione lyase family enzyme
MLGGCEIITFVATAKPDAAADFYRNVLGLTLVSDDPYALVFDANGTMLRVAKMQKVTVVPNTVLGWKVTDIRAAIEELSKKGVRFQRYEGMPQDDFGIWDSGTAKVAWFKDPDGNTLSLTQF